MNNIYIACPANFATGGTELLHQLAYKLKKNRENVKMFYFNTKEDEFPVAERFKKYNIEFVKQVKDSEGSLLIVPEVSAYLLKDYKKVKKVIWWLSVDNYLIKLNTAISLRKKISMYLRGKNKEIKNQYKDNRVDFNDKQIIHLAQSYYAIDFLEKNGVKNTFYLSDYLGESFLKKEVAYSSKKRENIVLYNPRKGLDYTRKIMEKSDECTKFLPLENMTPDEIARVCLSSKIYIDFGNHPGKDRFPREAATLGCIVITGRKGAANFYEDVRIKDEYKFEDKDENIENIIDKLKECFEKYDEKIDDFKEYRKMIRGEEKIFEEDIEKIFAYL